MSEKQKIVFSLAIYHLLFILGSFNYYIKNGGDAYLYWFNSEYVHNKLWFDFLNYGTDFMLFLNYPFVKLGLSFFMGFLLYGTIGFMGVLKWIQWTGLVFKDEFIYKNFNVLYFIFFLPNLHFWTAALGKESIVFWGIAAVFYAIASNNYKTFSFIVGSLVLVLIRPHVAFMLLFAVAFVLFFNKSYPIKKRIAMAIVVLICLTIMLFMVFQLTQIKYFDWSRIIYFNDYSIMSFKHSNSYVPMLDYNYFHKFFTFNFSPLFFDSKNVLGIFASFENAFILGILFVSLFYIVKFYKNIRFTSWMKIAFLFTFIATLLYVQRYANLGIFMRTKSMFQPFLVVALLFIIKQGMLLQKSKS